MFIGEGNMSLMFPSMFLERNVYFSSYMGRKHVFHVFLPLFSEICWILMFIGGRKIFVMFPSLFYVRLFCFSCSMGWKQVFHVSFLLFESWEICLLLMFYMGRKHVFHVYSPLSWGRWPSLIRRVCLSPVRVCVCVCVCECVCGGVPCA